MEVHVEEEEEEEGLYSGSIGRRSTRDERAAKRYRLDVLSSSSDFGGKVSETTSGRANFSSRFSRIIPEKLSAQSFPTAGPHIPSRFT